MKVYWHGRYPFVTEAAMWLKDDLIERDMECSLALAQQAEDDEWMESLIVAEEEIDVYMSEM